MMDDNEWEMQRYIKATARKASRSPERSLPGRYQKILRKAQRGQSAPRKRSANQQRAMRRRHAWRNLRKAKAMARSRTRVSGQRYITPGGHIFHRDDPGLVDSLAPKHDKALNIGFFGAFAAAAAAAALIPGGAGVRSAARPVRAPKGALPIKRAPKVKPPIAPAPRPSNEKALRAEIEKSRRAMLAAQAEVVAERARSKAALKAAEAAEAKRQAEATANEAKLAKASGDAKAFELAMGKLKTQLAEARRAQSEALKAGDQAQAAAIVAAKLAAKKAGERAAAEIKARKAAEAALAVQEKKERAADAADAKAHAAALAAKVAEMTALRNAATTRTEQLEAERKRLRLVAAQAEAEKLSRIAAEKELAAAKAALAALKENQATPPAPRVEMQPREAAIALRFYLLATPTPAGFGFKNHANAQVQTYQRYLNTPADGIIGGDTRKAARSHGVELPPRPTVAVAPPPLPPPPPPAPVPPEIPPEPEAPGAAQARILRDFLLANPTRAAFGFRGNPSPPVVTFQRASGITDDGIVGQGVRSAARVHGVTLPLRPS